MVQMLDIFIIITTTKQTVLGGIKSNYLRNWVNPATFSVLVPHQELDFQRHIRGLLYSII